MNLNKGIRNLIILLIIIPVILLYNNCKNNNNEILEIETFKFPILINKLPAKYETVSYKWKNEEIHHPFYFGKLKDTISIEHFLSPFEISESEIETIDLKLEPRNITIDNYYIDWMSKRNFIEIDSADIQIRIDTMQVITNNNFRKSYPIILRNKSSDTIRIGYGNRIPIITEALTKKGEWKEIQNFYGYFCGVGVPNMILPPNEIIITSEVIYFGNFKPKLRVKIGMNVSNEFNGKINQTQFINKWNTRH